MNLSKRIARLLPKGRAGDRRLLRLLPAIHDISLSQAHQQLQAQSKNPLNRFGRKCFSQNDEDGLTLEILRRMGALSNGVYAEFGVGDGTENNTLILAALGWKGFWVGGGEIKPNVAAASQARRFAYLRDWVTLDNVVALTHAGMAKLAAERIDVLSMDLDGNDLHFADAILKAGVRPKLFIVEYNAKFPPPVEFSIPYDAQHAWRSNDYFGASLASFVRLFSEFRYRLICCNGSGANAFFIEESSGEHFKDIPDDVSSIYREPRYWLYRHYGHPVAVATIEQVINDMPAMP
jgi:hypothetical protein